uniref:Uncharacterized protein n=1 Tax=Oryza punctata TaxID=4537 RepID=A0A0E0LUQ6_ORYPU
LHRNHLQDRRIVSPSSDTPPRGGIEASWVGSEARAGPGIGGGAVERRGGAARWPPIPSPGRRHRAILAAPPSQPYLSPSPPFPPPPPLLSPDGDAAAVIPVVLRRRQGALRLRGPLLRPRRPRHTFRHLLLQGREDLSLSSGSRRGRLCWPLRHLPAPPIQLIILGEIRFDWIPLFYLFLAQFDSVCGCLGPRIWCHVRFVPD